MPPETLVKMNSGGEVIPYIYGINWSNVDFERTLFFDGTFQLRYTGKGLEPQVDVTIQRKREFSSLEVGLITGRMLPI